ncbi:MAG: DUF3883 domain-containing protein [Planctomycetaceae bacterium]|nr:DUF3883 domain-containing protein [Planctomycetaceae bacterium]
MTATPHKGDPEAFCLFLQLLDRDVYANVKSLEEAIKQKSAPFYLRRTKEALVTFPDKDGRSKRIFTRRHVKTVEFQINEAELELYDALTDYVEEQSVKAAMDNSPAARAIGFTMAMLQRRFASSVYAVRKTLERMADNRKKILADPEKYRQDKIDAKIPDDFDDYSDEEQIEILSKIENVVPSVNPVLLREEIATLETLITKAKTAESQEIETKLAKLKQLLQDEKVFGDKKMKILIFTEHKDTLDYLVGKLREWGLAVTQIHGSMKVGDRETRGTRIYAEREFREYAQVLVATEAAGEGINLQFCWLMVNYDIPWNPVRLEQRMGRIHRYGQEKECLIHNFVSVNTREGRVMQKLFDRIEQIENDLDPEHTGKVFNVLGDIFPANQIEKWVREMYAKNQMDEELLKERIVEDVDTERLRKITDSALEGLAKRNLNLGAIIRDKVTAKERRLVPQVIENFFRTAAAKIFLDVKVLKPNTYKIEKLPQRLIQVGNELETQNGRIGTEYKRFVFDREKLAKDPTCEWVTPGHPLFEAVRQFIENRALKELQNGTVLYDINTATPYHLDVFIAEINDGLGKIVIEKLLCVKTDANGEKTVKEPTLFLDLTASGTTAVPAVNRDGRTPGDAENFAIEYLMQHVFPEVQKEREHQTDVVREHLIMSLDALIDQANYRLCDFCVESDDPMFEANKKMAEDHFTDLEIRKKTRLAELKKERQVMPGNIRHIGKAWILPNPEREKPAIKPMLKDDEIEKIAVDAVIKHEEANGYTVVSVEADNCGYDLRSVHPVTNEVRFIEVKGRAATGDVLLTPNEKQTAERLQDDYYLYIVLNCAETPEIHIVRNPAKEQMQPVVKHYIYKLKDTE